MPHLLNVLDLLSAKNWKSHHQDRGRISNLNRISKQLFKAHYHDQHSKAVSHHLAIVLKRYVRSTVKTKRRTLAFVEEIRRTLLFLHEYNLRVAKVKLSNKYPMSRHFNNLLVQYIELECEALYSQKSPVNRQAERDVAQRVLRLLHVILYDAIHCSEVDPDLETTTKTCFKIMLKLVTGVRADCNCENRVVADLIMLLIDKIDINAEINKLKGRNIPFYLDTSLIDQDVLKLRENLAITGYESDRSDSDIEESVLSNQVDPLGFLNQRGSANGHKMKQELNSSKIPSTKSTIQSKILGFPAWSESESGSFFRQSKPTNNFNDKNILAIIDLLDDDDVVTPQRNSEPFPHKPIQLLSEEEIKREKNDDGRAPDYTNERSNGNSDNYSETSNNNNCNTTSTQNFDGAMSKDSSTGTGFEGFRQNRLNSKLLDSNILKDVPKNGESTIVAHGVPFPTDTEREKSNSAELITKCQPEKQQEMQTVSEADAVDISESSNYAATKKVIIEKEKMFQTTQSEKKFFQITHNEESNAFQEMKSVVPEVERTSPVSVAEGGKNLTEEIVDKFIDEVFVEDVHIDEDALLASEPEDLDDDDVPKNSFKSTGGSTDSHVCQTLKDAEESSPVVITLDLTDDDDEASATVDLTTQHCEEQTIDLTDEITFAQESVKSGSHVESFGVIEVEASNKSDFCVRHEQSTGVLNDESAVVQCIKEEYQATVPKHVPAEDQRIPSETFVVHKEATSKEHLSFSFEERICCEVLDELIDEIVTSESVPEADCLAKDSRVEVTKKPEVELHWAKIFDQQMAMKQNTEERLETETVDSLSLEQEMSSAIPMEDNFILETTEEPAEQSAGGEFTVAGPTVEEHIVLESEIEELAVMETIVKQHYHTVIIEESIVESLTVEEPIVEQHEPTLEEPTVQKHVKEHLFVKASLERSTFEEPSIEKHVEQLSVEEHLIEQLSIEEPTVDQVIVESPVVVQPTVEEHLFVESTLEKSTIKELSVEKHAKQLSVKEHTAEQRSIDESIVKHVIGEDPVVAQPTVEEHLTVESMIKEHTVGNPTVEEHVEQLDVGKPIVDEHLFVESTLERSTIAELSVEKHARQYSIEEHTVEHRRIEEPIVEHVIGEDTNFAQSTAEEHLTVESTIEEHTVKQPTVDEHVEQLGFDKPIVEEHLFVESTIEKPKIQEFSVEKQLSDEEHTVEQRRIEEPIVEHVIDEDPVVIQSIIEEHLTVESTIKEHTVEKPAVEEHVEQPGVDKPIVEEHLFVESTLERSPIEEFSVEKHAEQLPLAEHIVEERSIEEPIVKHVCGEDPVVAQSTVQEHLTVESTIEEHVKQPRVDKPIVEEHLFVESTLERSTIEEFSVEKHARQLSDEEHTVEQPSIEEPIVEHVIGEYPVVAQSTVEEHLTVESTIEEHTVEKPTVEEHVEQPGVNKPIVEEHLFVESKLERSTIEECSVEKHNKLLPVEDHTVDQRSIEEPNVEHVIGEDPVVAQSTVEEHLTVESTIEEHTVEENPTVEELVEQPGVDKPIVEEHLFVESTLEKSTIEGCSVEKHAEQLSVKEHTAEQRSIDESIVKHVIGEDPVVAQSTVEEHLTVESLIEEHTVEKPTVGEHVEEPDVDKSIVKEHVFVESTLERSTIEECSVEKHAKQLSVEEHTIEQKNIEGPIVELVIGQDPVVAQATVEKHSTVESTIEEHAGEKPTVEEHVEQLAVDKPIVEEHTFVEPTLERSTIELPIEEHVDQLCTEEHIVDQLCTEEHIVEQLTIEDPIVSQPTVEEHIIVEPSIEGHKIEKPTIEEHVKQLAVGEQQFSVEDPIISELIVEGHPIVGHTIDKTAVEATVEDLAVEKVVSDCVTRQFDENYYSTWNSPVINEEVVTTELIDKEGEGVESQHSTSVDCLASAAAEYQILENKSEEQSVVEGGVGSDSNIRHEFAISSKKTKYRKVGKIEQVIDYNNFTPEQILVDVESKEREFKLGSGSETETTILSLIEAERKKIHIDTSPKVGDKVVDGKVAETFTADNFLPTEETSLGKDSEKAELPFKVQLEKYPSVAQQVLEPEQVIFNDSPAVLEDECKKDNALLTLADVAASQKNLDVEGDIESNFKKEPLATPKRRTRYGNHPRKTLPHRNAREKNHYLSRTRQGKRIMQAGSPKYSTKNSSKETEPHDFTATIISPRANNVYNQKPMMETGLTSDDSNDSCDSSSMCIDEEVLQQGRTLERDIGEVEPCDPQPTPGDPCISIPEHVGVSCNSSAKILEALEEFTDSHPCDSPIRKVDEKYENSQFPSIDYANAKKNDVIYQVEANNEGSIEPGLGLFRKTDHSIETILSKSPPLVRDTVSLTIEAVVRGETADDHQCTPLNLCRTTGDREQSNKHFVSKAARKYYVPYVQLTRMSPEESTDSTGDIDVHHIAAETEILHEVVVNTCEEREALDLSPLSGNKHNEVHPQNNARASRNTVLRKSTRIKLRHEHNLKPEVSEATIEEAPVLDSNVLITNTSSADFVDASKNIDRLSKLEAMSSNSENVKSQTSQKRTRSSEKQKKIGLEQTINILKERLEKPKEIVVDTESHMKLSEDAIGTDTRSRTRSKAVPFEKKTKDICSEDGDAIAADTRGRRRRKVELVEVVSSKYNWSEDSEASGSDSKNKRRRGASKELLAKGVQEEINKLQEDGKKVEIGEKSKARSKSVEDISNFKKSVIEMTEAKENTEATEKKGTKRRRSASCKSDLEDVTFKPVNVENDNRSKGRIMTRRCSKSSAVDIHEKDDDNIDLNTRSKSKKIDDKNSGMEKNDDDVDLKTRSKSKGIGDKTSDVEDDDDIDLKTRSKFKINDYKNDDVEKDEDDIDLKTRFESKSNDDKNSGLEKTNAVEVTESLGKTVAKQKSRKNKKPREQSSDKKEYNEESKIGSLKKDGKKDLRTASRSKSVDNKNDVVEETSVLKPTTKKKGFNKPAEKQQPKKCKNPKLESKDKKEQNEKLSIASVKNEEKAPKKDEEKDIKSKSKSDDNKNSAVEETIAFETTKQKGVIKSAQKQPKKYNKPKVESANKKGQNEKLTIDEEKRAMEDEEKDIKTPSKCADNKNNAAAETSTVETKRKPKGVNKSTEKQQPKKCKNLKVESANKSKQNEKFATESLKKKDEKTPKKDEENAIKAASKSKSDDNKNTAVEETIVETIKQKSVFESAQKQPKKDKKSKVESADQEALIEISTIEPSKKNEEKTQKDEEKDIKTTPQSKSDDNKNNAAEETRVVEATTTRKKDAIEPSEKQQPKKLKKSKAESADQKELIKILTIEPSKKNEKKTQKDEEKDLKTTPKSKSDDNKNNASEEISVVETTTKKKDIKPAEKQQPKKFKKSKVENIDIKEQNELLAIEPSKKNEEKTQKDEEKDIKTAPKSKRDDIKNIDTEEISVVETTTTTTTKKKDVIKPAENQQPKKIKKSKVEHIDIKEQNDVLAIEPSKKNEEKTQKDEEKDITTTPKSKSDDNKIIAAEEISVVETTTTTKDVIKPTEKQQPKKIKKSKVEHIVIKEQNEVLVTESLKKNEEKASKDEEKHIKTTSKPKSDDNKNDPVEETSVVELITKKKDIIKPAEKQQPKKCKKLKAEITDVKEQNEMLGIESLKKSEEKAKNKSVGNVDKDTKKTKIVEIITKEKESLAKTAEKLTSYENKNSKDKNKLLKNEEEKIVKVASKKSSETLRCKSPRRHNLKELYGFKPKKSEEYQSVQEATINASQKKVEKVDKAKINVEPFNLLQPDTMKERKLVTEAIKEKEKKSAEPSKKSESNRKETNDRKRRLSLSPSNSKQSEKKRRSNSENDRSKALDKSHSQDGKERKKYEHSDSRSQRPLVLESEPNARKKSKSSERRNESKSKLTSSERNISEKTEVERKAEAVKEKGSTRSPSKSLERKNESKSKESKRNRSTSSEGREVKRKAEALEEKRRSPRSPSKSSARRSGSKSKDSKRTSSDRSSGKREVDSKYKTEAVEYKIRSRSKGSKDRSQSKEKESSHDDRKRDSKDKHKCEVIDKTKNDNTDKKKNSSHKHDIAKHHSRISSKNSEGESGERRGSVVRSKVVLEKTHDSSSSPTIAEIKAYLHSTKILDKHQSESGTGVSQTPDVPKIMTEEKPCKDTRPVAHEKMENSINVMIEAHTGTVTEKIHDVSGSEGKLKKVVDLVSSGDALEHELELVQELSRTEPNLGEACLDIKGINEATISEVTDQSHHIEEAVIESVEDFVMADDHEAIIGTNSPTSTLPDLAEEYIEEPRPKSTDFSINTAETNKTVGTAVSVDPHSFVEPVTESIELGHGEKSVEEELSEEMQHLVVKDIDHGGKTVEKQLCEETQHPVAEDIEHSHDQKFLLERPNEESHHLITEDIGHGEKTAEELSSEKTPNPIAEHIDHKHDERSIQEQPRKEAQHLVAGVIRHGRDEKIVELSIEETHPPISEENEHEHEKIGQKQSSEKTQHVISEDIEHEPVETIPEVRSNEETQHLIAENIEHGHVEKILEEQSKEETQHLIAENIEHGHVEKILEEQSNEETQHLIAENIEPGRDEKTVEEQPRKETQILVAEDIEHDGKILGEQPSQGTQHLIAELIEHEHDEKIIEERSGEETQHPISEDMEHAHRKIVQEQSSKETQHLITKDIEHGHGEKILEQSEETHGLVTEHIEHEQGHKNVEEVPPTLVSQISTINQNGPIEHVLHEDFERINVNVTENTEMPYLTPEISTISSERCKENADVLQTAAAEADKDTRKETDGHLKNTAVETNCEAIVENLKILNSSSEVSEGCRQSADAALEGSEAPIKAGGVQNVESEEVETVQEEIKITQPSDSVEDVVQLEKEVENASEKRHTAIENVPKPAPEYKSDILESVETNFETITPEASAKSCEKELSVSEQETVDDISEAIVHKQQEEEPLVKGSITGFPEVPPSKQQEEGSLIHEKKSVPTDIPEVAVKNPMEKIRLEEPMPCTNETLPFVPEAQDAASLLHKRRYSNVSEPEPLEPEEREKRKRDIEDVGEVQPKRNKERGERYEIGSNFSDEETIMSLPDEVLSSAVKQKANFFNSSQRLPEMFANHLDSNAAKILSPAQVEIECGFVEVGDKSSSNEAFAPDSKSLEISSGVETALILSTSSGSSIRTFCRQDSTINNFVPEPDENLICPPKTMELSKVLHNVMDTFSEESSTGQLLETPHLLCALSLQDISPSRLRMGSNQGFDSIPNSEGNPSIPYEDVIDDACSKLASPNLDGSGDHTYTCSMGGPLLSGQVVTREEREILCQDEAPLRNTPVDPMMLPQVDIMDDDLGFSDPSNLIEVDQLAIEYYDLKCKKEKPDLETSIPVPISEPAPNILDMLPPEQFKANSIVYPGEEQAPNFIDVKMANKYAEEQLFKLTQNNPPPDLALPDDIIETEEHSRAPNSFSPVVPEHIIETSQESLLDCGVPTYMMANNYSSFIPHQKVVVENIEQCLLVPKIKKDHITPPKIMQDVPRKLPKSVKKDVKPDNSKDLDLQILTQRKNFKTAVKAAPRRKTPTQQSPLKSSVPIKPPEIPTFDSKPLEKSPRRKSQRDMNDILPASDFGSPESFGGRRIRVKNNADLMMPTAPPVTGSENSLAKHSPQTPKEETPFPKERLSVPKDKDKPEPRFDSAGNDLIMEKILNVATNKLPDKKLSEKKLDEKVDVKKILEVNNKRKNDTAPNEDNNKRAKKEDAGEDLFDKVKKSGPLNPHWRDETLIEKRTEDKKYASAKDTTKVREPHGVHYQSRDRTTIPSRDKPHSQLNSRHHEGNHHMDRRRDSHRDRAHYQGQKSNSSHVSSQRHRRPPSPADHRRSQRVIPDLKEIKSNHHTSVAPQTSRRTDAIMRGAAAVDRSKSAKLAENSAKSQDADYSWIGKFEDIIGNDTSPPLFGSPGSSSTTP